MSMRRQFAGIGIAVFLCSPWSHAQESLVGSYKGSIGVTTTSSRSANLMIGVDIASVQGGKVEGKFRQMNGKCLGEYPMVGKVEGDSVGVKWGEGAVQGCGNSGMRLTVQGGKLVGKWGKYDVELSK